MASITIKVDRNPLWPHLGKQLYLAPLRFTLEKGIEVRLQFRFPENPEREWFRASGVLSPKQYNRAVKALSNDARERAGKEPV